MFVELDKQFKELIANPGLLWKNPVKGAASQILPPVFQTGFNVLKYEHLERLDKLGDLVDDNTLLVVAFRHKSHSDILACIRLAQEISQRVPNFEKFYFPAAKSLVEGMQGFVPQLLYAEGTVPLLNEAGLIPLPVVTDNDQIKRGMSPTGSDIRRIMRAVAEPKSAILDLAEGMVEGGRYDVLGNIRGMQYVTNKFLPLAVLEAFRKDKRVVSFSVGITGTNRMLSAESLFLTWRGVGALIEDWILEDPPTIGTVIIGEPYIFENPGFDLQEPTKEALEKHSQEVNDQMMYRVAELVPFLERGYYDPRTRKYQEAIKSYEQKVAKEPMGRLRLRLLKRGLLPYPEELQQIASLYPKEEPI